MAAPADPAPTDAAFPEIESHFSLGLRRFKLVEKLRTDAPAGPAAGAAARPVRYQFEGELGRGGMGVVYKVRDLDLQRTLAMKVVRAAERPPDAPDGDSRVDTLRLSRFLEEAQVTGQLDHPGIVPLHDLGIDPQGRVYFTMRLVRGQHFGEVIAQVRAGSAEWTLDRALIVLVKTTEAMAYAHDKGVVHRDLKPANVMTGRFGEVYVMDWGLAKAQGRAPRPASEPDAVASRSIVEVRRSGLADDAHVTVEGTVFGTPVYMAPEQAQGRAEQVDRRSDVYSLGAMLYHLLVGQAPYVPPEARVSASAVLKWVVEGPPKPVRQLAPGAPADLAAICERCMARAPEHRYPDMVAVGDELRRYLRGQPVLANPLSPATRTLRWSRRNPVVAGFLVALTLAAAVGFWSLSRLSASLVRSSALDSAASEAQMFEDVNALYSSEVVNRVDRSVVTVTHDFTAVPGAIPLPATFLTVLAEHISERGSGDRVRHYSDLPFRSRTDGGPRDAFETEALASLRADPETPYYRFETRDGLPLLRYAAARRMKQSCVDCHNTHPDSPRTDWKVGDVRGVLAIVRPLDQDVARTRQGLAGTFTLVGGLGVGLLALSAFLLVRQSRARS